MRSTELFSRPALALALAAMLLSTSPALAQTEAGQAEPSRTQQIGQDAAQVAKSPLKDVGVVKDKIPQVLIDARTATYALPSPLTCATIFDAVDALNA